VHLLMRLIEKLLIINFMTYLYGMYPVQRDDRWISEHAEEKKSISNFLLFCRDFLARDIDSFYVLSTTYHATSLIPVNFRLPGYVHSRLSRARDRSRIDSIVRLSRSVPRRERKTANSSVTFANETCLIFRQSSHRERAYH